MPPKSSSTAATAPPAAPVPSHSPVPLPATVSPSVSPSVPLIHPGLFAGLHAWFASSLDDNPAFLNAFTLRGGLVYMESAAPQVRLFLSSEPLDPETRELQNGHMLVWRPDWILDCVESGSILPIKDYLLPYGDIPEGSVAQYLANREKIAAATAVEPEEIKKIAEKRKRAAESPRRKQLKKQAVKELTVNGVAVVLSDSEDSAEAATVPMRPSQRNAQQEEKSRESPTKRAREAPRASKPSALTEIPRITQRDLLASVAELPRMLSGHLKWGGIPTNLKQSDDIGRDQQLMNRLLGEDEEYEEMMKELMAGGKAPKPQSAKKTQEKPENAGKGRKSGQNTTSANNTPGSRRRGGAAK